MPHLKTKWNEYAAQLLVSDKDGSAGGTIDKIPKMVALAVAVSALTNGGDQIDLARERFITEWWTLFDNGIVPQKPPFQRNETVSL